MDTFQEFPVGKKFIKVESEQVIKRLQTMMNIDFIKACKLLTDSKIGRTEYFSPHVGNLSDVEILSEGTYPIIKAGRSTLLALNWTFNSYVEHKAALYQSALRIYSLGNIANLEGMQIQWDDTRKGLKIHDYPYEGELVPTKDSAAVKRKLKDHLDTLLSEVGMYTLLGKELKTPTGFIWKRSDAKVDTLEETICNTLRDKPKFEHILEVAMATGVYVGRWGKNGHVLERTNNKPKLYTSVRTRLLYKMGALTLPDNYQDWFDG